MSGRTYTFKVVYKPDTDTFYVAKAWNIVETLEHLTNWARTRFNIANCYDIEVVVPGNFARGEPELAPSINESVTCKFVEKFAHVNTFYLRPVHPITRGFVYCNDYSDPSQPPPTNN